MNLSIVIPTKDRLPLLMAQLMSLEPLMDICEVIVVDDSSQEDFDIVRNVYESKVTFIRGEGRGATGAANLGLMAATNDRVLFLPDDQTIVGSPTAFAVGLIAAFSKAEMVGIRMLSDHVESKALRKLAWWVFSQTFPEAGSQSGYIDWVSLFAVDRKKVPLLFDTYFEGNGFNAESDFQLRARRDGARLWYSCELEVRQADEGSLARTREGEKEMRAKGHSHFLRKNFASSWHLRQLMFRIYLELVFF